MLDGRCLDRSEDMLVVARGRVPDVRFELRGVLGGQAFYGGMSPSRPMTWVRNNHHSASTWLRAFRTARLSVEECIEEPFSDEQIASSPADLVFPDAAKAAMAGLASVWAWVVRKG